MQYANVQIINHLSVYTEMQIAKIAECSNFASTCTLPSSSLSIAVIDPVLSPICYYKYRHLYTPFHYTIYLFCVLPEKLVFWFLMCSFTTIVLCYVNWYLSTCVFVSFTCVPVNNCTNQVVLLVFIFTWLYLEYSWITILPIIFM